MHWLASLFLFLGSLLGFTGSPLAPMSATTTGQLPTVVAPTTTPQLRSSDRYVNAQYRYSVTIPHGWKVEDPAVRHETGAVVPTAVAFYSPDYLASTTTPDVVLRGEAIWIDVDTSTTTVHFPGASDPSAVGVLPAREAFINHDTNAEWRDIQFLSPQPAITSILLTYASYTPQVQDIFKRFLASYATTGQGTDDTWDAPVYRDSIGAYVYWSDVLKLLAECRVRGFTQSGSSSLTVTFNGDDYGVRGAPADFAMQKAQIETLGRTCPSFPVIDRGGNDFPGQ